MSNHFRDWTGAQIEEYNTRPKHPGMAKRIEASMASELAPADHETGKHGLQAQIMDWCDAQWPRWVYDFPRTDLKSTLPLGRHDATIWGPFPTCYCCETKAKGKKQSEDQLVWATKMRAIGWTVHVLYSLEAFLALVQPALPQNPPERVQTHD